MIKDYNLEIISKKFLNETTVELGLNFENSFNYKPGQFLMLKIDKFFLRRPFVIIDNKIVFKICGKGTKELSKMAIGQKVSVLMPLGNFFPETSNKNIVLIGGGIGVASLIPLLNKYKGKNIVSFLGFKCKEDVFYEKLFKNAGKLNLSTDDGSYMCCGLITKLVLENIDLLKSSSIYACGPNAMLKEISYILSSNGIQEAYFSFEERMACGVGACFACPINTIGGIKRVCTDGPIFKHTDIIWE